MLKAGWPPHTLGGLDICGWRPSAVGFLLTLNDGIEVLESEVKILAKVPQRMNVILA